jgi:hypothetical protein
VGDVLRDAVLLLLALALVWIARPWLAVDAILARRPVDDPGP